MEQIYEYANNLIDMLINSCDSTLIKYIINEISYGGYCSNERFLEFKKQYLGD